MITHFKNGRSKLSTIRDFGQQFQTKIYWQSQMAHQNYKWLIFWSVIPNWVIITLPNE
jgi:hypothetical protein